METKLSKPKIKKYFNSVSIDYFYEREKEYAFRVQKGIVLRMLGTGDGNGKKVVDIGCGSGLLTGDLLERGYEVWGIDISEEMISNAKTILLDKKINNSKVHYLLGDIEKLDLPDNYFDAVISIGVLEYLSTYNLALKEIYRVLRPCGVSIISLPTKISPYYILYKLSEKSVIPIYKKTIKKLLNNKTTITDPYRNLCVTWKFDKQLIKFGFEKFESEFCIFIFYPINHFFPKLSINISKKLEIFSKSKLLGWLGSQYIIKVAKKNKLNVKI